MIFDTEPPQPVSAPSDMFLEFDLDVQVTTDAPGRYAERGCDTSDGCGSTCASACASS